MDTIELASKLIANPSITPNDANCQQLIGDYLASNGFLVKHLQFGEVSNIWATHGNQAPCIAFAGHTDVVPPGELTAWTTNPFAPTIRNGYLHGRGTVDMKGSLAAMLTAAVNFVTANPNHPGTIGFLITSDEEGDAINGTNRVVEFLQQQNIQIDYCMIGEPTSEHTIADTLQIGRRGSIVAEIKVLGVQGHVAYPEQVKNPIFAVLPILNQLAAKEWDKGNNYFPPSNLQISSLNAPSPASNVTPHSLTCTIPIRFSPEITPKRIQAEVEKLLRQQPLKYDINWKLHGEPFLTKPGNFVDIASKAIYAVTNAMPKISTAGGTSDGRFIAKMRTQVIELGPITELMHKVDECVAIEDLYTLHKIYAKFLQLLLMS